MEIRNCKKCGRMFNYIFGPPICPQCKDEREAKFQDVKKYVQDNKNATMVDVCDQCNVEPEQLRQWIREERLQFADDSPIKISCERCGAMIGFGRFCNKCKISLSQEVNSAIKPVINETSETRAHPSSRNKMRFL